MLDVADWVVEDVPEVEELVSVVTWGVQFNFYGFRIRILQGSVVYG